MRTMPIRWMWRAAVGWLAAVASTMAMAQAAAVETLRIVGGLDQVHQYTHHEEPFWLQALPRLSGGRARAEIVPFDRAGLGGEELLRVVQMGAVPFATLLLSRSSSIEPELGAPDLAGLNPEMADLRRSVAQVRPRLGELLRDRHGLELLAIYTYPAQVLFCARAFTGLADLSGRRVRVSSATQADFFAALGAQPVQTPFAQIVANMKSGTLDCAVTGTLSGHTIGLHEATSHVHAMAINWGLAAFVANGAAWQALSAPLRALLQRELPQLEQRIWADAERHTLEGLHCVTGSGACSQGRTGRMSLVAMSAADERLRANLLRDTVGPAWVQRCGEPCARLWRARQAADPAATTRR